MKTISARQFQHGFSKTTETLKPGQSITITKRGKPLGAADSVGCSLCAGDWLERLVR